MVSNINIAFGLSITIMLPVTKSKRKHQGKKYLKKNLSRQGNGIVEKSLFRIYVYFSTNYSVFVF